MDNNWPSISALSLTVHCEGEDYELVDSMTLGRHLDNDIIVSGEDVLDYHARIEHTPRGATLHPLLNAVATVNGRAHTKPVTLTPLDDVNLGQTQLRLLAELASSAGSENAWSIVSSTGDRVALTNALVLGRSDDADVVIRDDHISRHHARLTLTDCVWLQDLGSANGTFVNGERLNGGVRLLHGDVFSLDAHRLQLRCDDSELTPINPIGNATTAAYVAMDTAGATDTEPDSEATVIGVAPPTQQPSTAVVAAATTGPHLVGVSDDIVERVFAARMGSTLIGREVSCDIVLDHPSVSARHAELINRAEGCSITNLIATNGTLVNDVQVTTQVLQHGDRLTLGQVQMLFQDTPTAQPANKAGQRIAILLASLAIAALLTWWW